MLIAGLIALGGAVIALLAWVQARAGRLSTGHGVAWFVAGIAMLVAAAAWSLLVPSAAPRSAATLLLLGVVSILAAFVFSHAVILSRVQERLKILAQDVALLRAARQQTGGAPRSQSAEDGRQAPGCAG